MKLHDFVPEALLGPMYRFGFSLHFGKRLETRIMKRWLPLNTGDRVCDIGCGMGILDSMLSTKSCEIFGVDSDEERIRLAVVINRKRANSFSVGNAEALPFKSASFNKATCNSTLEHFSNDIQAIREMARVLKPGGLLFLSVDSLSYPKISDQLRETFRRKAKVVNFFDFEDLNKKLEGAGFIIRNRQYYVRSKIASLFMKFGIYTNWGLLYLLTFPLSYPLSLISDRLSYDDKGYFLAVLAEKVGD